jgi:hypothetical protein
MKLVQIGDMKYAVYDKRGKVVIITSVRTIAERYVNGDYDGAFS